jgi:hypothetical protein
MYNPYEIKLNRDSPVYAEEENTSFIPQNNFFNQGLDYLSNNFLPTLKDYGGRYIASQALGGAGNIIAGPIGGLIGGIGGLITGGNLFSETPEQSLMRDYYAQMYGLTPSGQIATGIMAGYNPVYGRGGAGLEDAYDRRIAMIERTRQKRGQLSLGLQKRLEELQAAKAAEQAARESAARSMQEQNRAEGTGGYQSSWGGVSDFMSGSGTSADMGSF